MTSVHNIIYIYILIFLLCKYFLGILAVLTYQLILIYCFGLSLVLYKFINNQYLILKFILQICAFIFIILELFLNRFIIFLFIFEILFILIYFYLFFLQYLIKNISLFIDYIVLILKFSFNF